MLLWPSLKLVCFQRAILWGDAALKFAHTSGASMPMSPSIK
jgi:hypothetical protein